jgi:Peroxisome biogenesis factor 1, N-terminal
VSTAEFLFVELYLSVAFLLRLFCANFSDKKVPLEIAFLTQLLFQYFQTLDNVDCYIGLQSCHLPSITHLDVTGERNNCSVSVKALEYIQCASELFVEPVTVDDWEMLELDAVSLEAGTFLQQISVVYTDQIFDLRLTSGAKASLKVLSRNFKCARATVWPEEATDAAASQKHPCLRLLAKTEIVIVPKPRLLRLKEHPLRPIPTYQDYARTDRSVLHLADCLNVNLISVKQGSIVVHPNTLSRIRGTDISASDICEITFLQAAPTMMKALNRKNLNTSVLVRVSVSIDIPKDCVGKNAILPI